MISDDFRERHVPHDDEFCMAGDFIPEGQAECDTAIAIRAYDEAVAERDEWWRTAERAKEELDGRPEVDGDLAIEMRDQQQLVERLWSAQADLLETLEAQNMLLERAWRAWDTVWAEEYREEMDFTDLHKTMEVIREHLDRDD